MKIIKSLFAFATLFALNSSSAHSIIEQWPQIKAYHEIISKTYLASEEGNMEHIKKNYGQLLEKAEELSVETMPEAYRNPKTIETLLVLKKQTAMMSQLIEEKKDDTQIKQALTSLHDTFYKIIIMCQPDKK
ncbi:hypothetical protein [Flavobacterium sp. XGLA_31]|uniref:hypothetical protein n=1 Tax=Flavobacterium sp. XGLA_31 TaxID=3447666 RepID=UPI003F350DCE